MIEIRKGDTLRTTWEELKISIKNNTSSLNVGDEIDIELKTGEKVTLVCERMGHRNATFFTKDLLEDTHCMNENWKAKNGERLSTMESYLSKLFRWRGNNGVGNQALSILWRKGKNHAKRKPKRKNQKLFCGLP